MPCRDLCISNTHSKNHIMIFVCFAKKQFGGWLRVGEELVQSLLHPQDGLSAPVPSNDDDGDDKLHAQAPVDGVPVDLREKKRLHSYRLDEPSEAYIKA